MSHFDCYFSPTISSTVTDHITGVNGTMMYETMNGNLYCDSGLTNQIGKIAISQTIFNMLDTTRNTFETTGQATLYLPLGTITYNIAAQTIKMASGHYMFPTSVNTFDIISGTGSYQSMHGKITSTTSEGTVNLRKFSISFYNACSYSYY